MHRRSSNCETLQLGQPDSPLFRLSASDQVSLQGAQIQGRKLQGSALRPSPASRAAVRRSPGASFLGFGLPGRCASSRLHHGVEFKIPKLDCRSHLAKQRPPLFAIFGRTSSQVFEQKHRKQTCFYIRFCQTDSLQSGGCCRTLMQT